MLPVDGLSIKPSVTVCAGFLTGQSILGRSLLVVGRGEGERVRGFKNPSFNMPRLGLCYVDCGLLRGCTSVR